MVRRFCLESPAEIRKRIDYAFSSGLFYIPAECRALGRDRLHAAAVFHGRETHHQRTVRPGRIYRRGGSGSDGEPLGPASSRGLRPVHGRRREACGVVEWGSGRKHDRRLYPIPVLHEEGVAVFISHCRCVRSAGDLGVPANEWPYRYGDTGWSRRKKI